MVYTKGPQFKSHSMTRLFGLGIATVIYLLFLIGFVLQTFELLSAISIIVYLLYSSCRNKAWSAMW